ncbi:hypothetical protein [Planobispora takensis]|uniref:Uncharacterized protein n=1 Tax=Planobispora takensis TaxID=1367882 RepID=A0A8J3T6X9_9ACTN|nr:hypothetical protein [Planobispora takensis]GII05253.1 hypothetical protein Pta02_72610 [Planobispora takensis]
MGGDLLEFARRGHYSPSAGSDGLRAADHDGIETEAPVGSLAHPILNRNAVNRPETDFHLLRADLPQADRVDAGPDRLT